MKETRGLWRQTALLLAITLFVSTLMLPSCDDGNGCISGSGGIVTKVLNIGPFHSIIAESDFEIRLEQGTEQLVEVDGHENIIGDITTEVSDNIWMISLTGECYNSLDIVVRITLPTIKSVESNGADRVILNSFDSLDQLTLISSGAGPFFQSGVLNVSDRLEIQNTGSGDMAANFSTPRLEVSMTGSGSIHLTGDAISQTVGISGSGLYSAFDMASNICVIEHSGSGNAEVLVEDDLDVKLTGSGNISYKGNPTITSMVTGSGQLIDAN